MTGRIGDAAQSARITNLLQQTQARLKTTQTAVATGHAVQRYGEIAGATAVLLRARSDRAAASEFARQNERLGDRLQAMDSAVGAVGELAERLRAVLVNRLDAATGSSVPLDEEIDAALAEIEGQLNLRLDGRYLFAGSRTDTAPVALPAAPSTVDDAALYFRGDAVVMSVRVSGEVVLDYGVTAADPAFSGMIGALGLARQAHLDGDRAGLETALTGLGSAVESLAQLRGELGARAARLDSITESHRSTGLYLDETIGRIVDTDLATALTMIAEDSAMLEAAYTTVGRLGRLSLADYLG